MIATRRTVRWSTQPTDFASIIDGRGLKALWSNGTALASGDLEDLPRSTSPWLELTEHEAEALAVRCDSCGRLLAGADLINGYCLPCRRAVVVPSRWERQT